MIENYKKQVFIKVLVYKLIINLCVINIQVKQGKRGGLLISFPYITL